MQRFTWKIFSHTVFSLLIAFTHKKVFMQKNWFQKKFRAYAQNSFNHYLVSLLICWSSGWLFIHSCCSMPTLTWLGALIWNSLLISSKYFDTICSLNVDEIETEYLKHPKNAVIIINEFSHVFCTDAVEQTTSNFFPHATIFLLKLKWECYAFVASSPSIKTQKHKSWALFSTIQDQWKMMKKDV